MDRRFLNSDIDQGTTNDNYQVKNSDKDPDNLCTSFADNCESLAVAECDINRFNTTSDISTMYQNIEVVLVESSNAKINDFALSSQNSDNTAKSSCNYQRYIPQVKSREKDIASVPKLITKNEKQKHSASTNYRYCNGLCCNISIFFIMCCIIGCWLMPVISFYVSKATARDNAVTDPGYPLEKNISGAKVCHKLTHLHIAMLLL